MAEFAVPIYLKLTLDLGNQPAGSSQLNQGRQGDSFDSFFELTPADSQEH